MEFEVRLNIGNLRADSTEELAIADSLGQDVDVEIDHDFTLSSFCIIAAPKKVLDAGWDLTTHLVELKEAI